MDGRCLWTPVLISEDVEEVKLGIDWLEHQKCVVDFKTKCLTIDGQETVTLMRLGHFKCQRLDSFDLTLRGPNAASYDPP